MRLFLDRRADRAILGAGAAADALVRIDDVLLALGDGFNGAIRGTGATGVKVKTAVTADDDIVLVSNASANATLTGAVKAGDIVTIGGKNYIVKTDATAASNELAITLTENITVATNAAATVITGNANNLVFHESAFAFVTRPLAAPAGVESYTTSYNGISLRVTRGYDMKYKKEMLSMDVLYGYKTMYPEMAVRVLG